ncbi:hypothetical protein DFH06DRAFT_1124240 [Mycena polygramma]|nr:hypothetical protein DFH06DRAFT_1124240 [Mycena polygramma]
MQGLQKEIELFYARSWLVPAKAVTVSPSTNIDKVSRIARGLFDNKWKNTKYPQRITISPTNRRVQRELEAKWRWIMSAPPTTHARNPPGAPRVFSVAFFDPRGPGLGSMTANSRIGKGRHTLRKRGNAPMSRLPVLSIKDRREGGWGDHARRELSRSITGGLVEYDGDSECRSCGGGNHQGRAVNKSRTHLGCCEGEGESEYGICVCGHEGYIPVDVVTHGELARGSFAGEGEREKMEVKSKRDAEVSGPLAGFYSRSANISNILIAQTSVPSSEGSAIDEASSRKKTQLSSMKFPATCTGPGDGDGKNKQRPSGAIIRIHPPEVVKVLRNAEWLLAQ